MTISSVGAGVPLTGVSRDMQVAYAKPDTSSPITIEDSVGSSRCPTHSTRTGIFQVMLPSSVACECAEAVETSQESPEMAPMLAKGIESPKADATDSQVAAYCNKIAKSDASLDERTEKISNALIAGVERTDSPDEAWSKATPNQIVLYVKETLIHVDSVREIGQLRGLNFDDHDLEEGTGKFEPSIAQFLAKPGRCDSVKWAIQKHNASPHHKIWNDSTSSSDELAESASDIVNAWRSERLVYEKPSWGWDRIASTIETQFQYNDISANQRDALLEAIPYQMDYEKAHA